MFSDRCLECLHVSNLKDDLGIFVVDEVIEQIRLGMEVNDFKQRLLYFILVLLIDFLKKAKSCLEASLMLQ